MDALRFTSAKARELGLRMDLTLGSGWPFGGPMVSIDDAAGMLRALLPAAHAVVFTSNPNPRALPPATLESLARQLDFTGDAEVVGDPERALNRGRVIAGPAGMVLATGSIYLVAGLAHARRAVRARMP